MAVALLRSRSLPPDDGPPSAPLPALRLGALPEGVPGSGGGANVRIDVAAGRVHVIATRDLGSDEPLLLGVGPLSSAQHFCRYGALPYGVSGPEGPLCNPHDRAAVRLSPRILRMAGGGGDGGTGDGNGGDAGGGDAGDGGGGGVAASGSVELRRRVLAQVSLHLLLILAASPPLSTSASSSRNP